MNRTHILIFSLATLSAALGGGSLHAQLTFVDADFGTNTSPTGALTTTRADDDGLWASRAFGTNATIFEADANEDALEIATTISGLTPGQSYSVWVNFYDPANDLNQNWPIQAGFTSGELTLFANGTDGGDAALEAAPAVLASDLTYFADPKFDDGGNRIMYAGSLGSIAANGSGEITVFIDNLNNGGGVNNRTWYDGVSYEVIPEPSTYAIMFGALALVYAGFRRRRGNR